MASLRDAQRMKFRLFAEGITIAEAARERLDELRGRRKLTPADYASTSGLILRLDNDVWVNAPIADYNSNFVRGSETILDYSAEGFVARGSGLECTAAVWLPPRYHDDLLSDGRPANHFVFTHGDRARLSPIRGCAMRCDFCNIPFEDPYQTKPVDSMIEALELAFADPLQPAQHALISGGTPIPSDVPLLRRVYETVLERFSGKDIDIMMVPVEGLFDLRDLKSRGLSQLSINIEIFDDRIARDLMPQKYRQGLDYYLEFISTAVEELGDGTVRSILMVGLEPAESTLAGVEAVLRVGGVPVLSPFRPDPATPLRNVPPLSAEAYEEIFLRASEFAASAGVDLGPSCGPCTHNTLTFVAGATTDHHGYPDPVVV